ncbi:S-layer homology domain-containing protein [Sporosarcina sp. P19]|uniref:S-layer homology domain-containing protein n=1 Tax=Sporosarcina sp. P19 TaxID=2048258 RepID=UPI0013043159|nr:S-layer homology domain-containing protein [Sporosarcina sp. P19]
MWKKWMTALLISVLAVTVLGQGVQAASFKDMKKYKTSLYVEVNYLADEGIISGYPDGRFKPNEPIAKKHIAAMFVKALELPTDDLKDPGYRDVPKNHPYYKEIAAAYTAGLFSKADRFKPESSISRAFMARLMSKAFQLKVLDKGDYQPPYTDVRKKSEFYTDIMRVSTNNVATGYPDGKFKPNHLITRGHFAAFLTRAMTVKQMNIMPNSDYTYYYTDSESMYRHDHEGINEENGLDYWRITNETEYEEIPRIGYMQNKSHYGAGAENWTHFDTYLAHPFAVMQTHKDDGIGPANYGDIWINSTNAVKSVHGVKYHDVLVVENYLWWNKETIIEYYAQDIGLIQKTNGKGNELYGLVKRVRN